MISLPVLQGYCTIQLHRKVGGSNWKPHTIKWEVCGNTLVSEADFPMLDSERWGLVKTRGLSYAHRVVTTRNGAKKKTTHILMAREILKLPKGIGCGSEQADHKNHDTLDNTQDNLRVATGSQNTTNRRNVSIRCRFKGVVPVGSRFFAQIKYKGQQVWFSIMQLEIEAGLMYFYAAKLLYKEFCYTDPFPESEMPSSERLDELYMSVVTKLDEVGLLN
jgi:hypothetical protein